MTRWRAVAGLVALASAPALALAGTQGESPGYWAHRKPITLPLQARGGFVEVLLDAGVYRDATPRLGDLRIRDRDSMEVAYVLRRHETAQTETERKLPLLDLQETDARDVRFVLDLGAHAGRHNRVRITFGDDARNFRVPVKVETSTDGRHWTLVRLAGFIYDVEGETRASDTSVSYPVSTARYVRVTITPPRGRSLPVEAASIVTHTPGERDEEPLPLTIVERGDDAKAKTTRLVLDLGSRRPVDRVELDVAERNFHRVVTIEASDDRQRWRWAGTGSLSAIETGKLADRQESLRFSEAPTRYLRLTIQNLDDRPLHASAVRAAAVRRGLVFQAVPGQTYFLDYGHPSVNAPRYDLIRTFPYVASETIPIATLGPATRLAAPAARAWTESQPIVLWAVMAGAVLALGGLLLRLARQVR